MRFDHQKPVETSQSETLDNTLYNKNNLHLYAARLDATYKKSKWFQFTFGGEYNSSRNSGHLEATGNMPDSDYKNTENRLAGFVEWAMETGRFSLSAGVTSTAALITKTLRMLPTILPILTTDYFPLSVSAGRGTRGAIV